MTRKPILLLAVSTFALGGCAASIAASVVGAALRASQSGQQASASQDLGPAAAAACSARASQHGEVNIIDVERRTDRVIVWGTVQSAQERQSFECRFDGKVSDFKLRTIPSR